MSRVLNAVRWWLVVFLLGCLPACNLDFTDKSAGTVTNTQVSRDPSTLGAFSCSASIPAGVTVFSGQPTQVTVVGAGGASPYLLPGNDQTGTFFPSTSVTRTYSNTSSTSIVVSDQVTLQDSIGQQSTCTFNVTIQPESAPPTTLSCTLSGSPTTVALNGTVNFVATSTGGVSPRTLSNFQPGTSGTITVPLNPSTGTASAIYSAAGQKTASVMVSDGVGNTASCSAVITVNSSPAVNVAVSPSTTQPTGSTFTLTASPLNFVNAPTTYTFVGSPAGVTVVQANPSSPTAQVYSTTLTNFSVTVTASNGAESANATVSLSYTGSSQLSCTLTHVAGTYYPGSTVTFNVSASTGEPLEIYQAVAQDGSGYFFNDTALVVFTSTGNKTMTVKARSKSTGQLCNGGNSLQDVVTISSPGGLSCTATTNINPANSGQFFIATISPTPNTGFVTITDIATSLPVNGQWITLASGIQAQMYINTRGTFLLTYTIRDTQSGAVGRCSSTQTIR